MQVEGLPRPFSPASASSSSDSLSQSLSPSPDDSNGHLHPTTESYDEDQQDANNSRPTTTASNDNTAPTMIGDVASASPQVAATSATKPSQVTAVLHQPEPRKQPLELATDVKGDKEALVDDLENVPVSAPPNTAGRPPNGQTGAARSPLLSAKTTALQDPSPILRSTKFQTPAQKPSIDQLDAVWKEPLRLPPVLRAASPEVQAMARHKLRTPDRVPRARPSHLGSLLSPPISGLPRSADGRQAKRRRESMEFIDPVVWPSLNGLKPATTPRPRSGERVPSSAASTTQTASASGRSDRATAPQPVIVEASSLAPFSLWEYLKEEVLATDLDSTQDMKWERVTNFIAVPWWVEQIILFGFVVCLDSFLYTFTILPLRFFVAVFLWCRNMWSKVFSGSSTPSTARPSLHSSHKCDILKALLVVFSCYILSKVTDASKMYHSVRGQDVIKLYVIFNVMEILDRLCCSLGQDLLDALFSRRTLARRKDGSQPILRPACFFLLALTYVQAHTMVLFYQLVTLNVAINSYDNALLTLLLSNQFVEIKGAVFKKFEKENLFQMTCADIVERFQLTLILSAIGVRNLIEVSGGSLAGGPSEVGGGGGEIPLPRSFTVIPSLSILETSFAPVALVLASECLVDWLKHAFITKFNHIRPAVYGRFMDVLCRDLVVAGPAVASAAQGKGSDDKGSTNLQPKPRRTVVDQSPIVSRRLGFAALPLACLLVRVSAQIWSMLADDSHFDECAIPDYNATMSTRPTSGGYLDLLLNLAKWTIGSLGVRDPQSYLDQTLDKTLRALAWSLPLFVGWVFLIAVKLLLGTFLISFATYRYKTMGTREGEEDLNNRERAPIGVDRGEREYEAKARQILMNEGSSSTKGGAENESRKSNTTRPAGTSLMDVSRYSMIKSRLW